MKSSQHEKCFGLSVRRADRVITQMYNDHLSTVGIKATQFSVLRALWYMKSTTAVQLQQVLVMDQTTLSRTLKLLIRDGFVHVTEGQTKREKNLSLSDEGLAIYKEALKHWKIAQQKLREHLGATLCDQLIGLSQEIVKLKP